MKKLILLGILSVSVTGWGAPTLYNKCTQVKINAVPGGAGVYLSDDCATAYVLPPLQGNLTITSITPSSNLQNCPVIESLYAVKISQAQRLADIAKKLNPPAQNGSGESGGLFPGGGTTAPSPGDEAALLADLAQVQKVNDQIDASLKEYAALEGANAEALFVADQQAMVKAYQSKNPGLRFEALPLAQARLTFARKTAPNMASQPAAFSTTISGLTTLPGFTNPTSDGSDSGLIFGGALAGQVTLSLVGACPLYDSKAQALTVTKLDNHNLGAYFSADVTYIYNLMVNRSYTASYNIASFFHRLETSESKGGFFDSSTVNRLIVEEHSEDWFKFKSLSEDPRHEFEDSLRETVKASLIDRVFKQVQLLTGGGKGEQAPGLATPQPDGASVAAKNLQKCPYVYCQIGAAVLEVADAIFGKSSAVSEYIHTQDYWATDDASESKMLPFLGTIVFGQ